MKKIKILNLYGTALGHNGDDKNILAFEKRISEMGYEYEETEMSVSDEIDTKGFDIVFITHGKPRNIAMISEHFCRYRDRILSDIDNGKVYVVTGAANMLFGKEFTMLDGKTYKGIGLFDCRCEEFDGLYVSDAVLVPDFDPESRVFGCYYRYANVKYDTPNGHRLFTVLKADGGEGNIGDGEGCHINNLYATWALGPVLVRNPVMMGEILRKVLGDDYRETDMSLEETAVRMILSEIM